jgi:predicted adenylyl cyclase CyaB
MPKEIEAKLKVDSFMRVARRLRKLGAEFSGELVQRDYYFDDAKVSLTRADRSLRLREEFSGRNKKVILAYKGAREKGRFKKRLEIETELRDIESARKLFGKVGYEERLIFEKKRRLWFLDGCKIALDKLPILGSFVEIEGASERQIAEVQERLGLSSLRHIKESYPILMERRLRELGRKKREVFLKGSR